jgi:hypothetical protein
MKHKLLDRLSKSAEDAVEYTIQPFAQQRDDDYDRRDDKKYEQKLHGFVLPVKDLSSLHQNMTVAKSEEEGLRNRIIRPRVA